MFNFLPRVVISTSPVSFISAFHPWNNLVSSLAISVAVIGRQSAYIAHTHTHVLAFEMPFEITQMNEDDAPSTVG